MGDQLPANAPCKQDGSLGTCESGLCVVCCVKSKEFDPIGG